MLRLLSIWPALSLGLLLASCGDKSGSNSGAITAATPTAASANSQGGELVTRAEAVLRGGVGYDPTKTQFRNVYVVQGDAVCGEINWTDASGNLRGFIPFIYRYGIGVKDDETERRPAFALAWQRLCEGRPTVHGHRSSLPEYQRQDFAQRLQAGKHEQASGWYADEIRQIETDLDPSQARALAGRAEEKNKQVEELARAYREGQAKR